MIYYFHSQSFIHTGEVPVHGESELVSNKGIKKIM